jgi:hypothetical protein
MIAGLQVVDFSDQTGAGQSTLDRISFLAYKLSDNVVYVNCSLPRPEIEEMLKQKTELRKKIRWIKRCLGGFETRPIQSGHRRVKLR